MFTLENSQPLISAQLIMTVDRDPRVCELVEDRGLLLTIGSNEGWIQIIVMNGNH
jgi:hypothetical protein